MRKGIGFLALLFTLAAPLIAQGPGQGQVARMNMGLNVQIQPLNGGGQFCVDVHNFSTQDGAQVYIYHCTGQENQRWTITSSTNDQHAIIGIGGMCLDVRGQHSRSNGTPVQLWQCHFGPNQRFHFSPDGRVREVSSGKCLIAVAPRDGAPLVLDDCKNTPDEIFAISH